MCSQRENYTPHRVEFYTYVKLCLLVLQFNFGYQQPNTTDGVIRLLEQTAIAGIGRMCIRTGVFGEVPVFQKHDLTSSVSHFYNERVTIFPLPKKKLWHLHFRVLLSILIVFSYSILVLLLLNPKLQCWKATPPS